jgi:prepilin-type N-terminal cleavage/methylation domain-containing protein
MSKLKTKNSKLKMGGFTLIEMMVSVAIFAVVMTIALGALLAMSESDRKAQTLKSVINNLNFAMDSMSRSIRTGTEYNCNIAGDVTAREDCPSSSASSIAFRSSGGSTYYYCLGDASTGSCSPTGTAILRSATGGNDAASITSKEVIITALKFYVTGATDANVQPKVTILIAGNVTVGAMKNTPFYLQTTVTQRLYDQN